MSSIANATTIRQKYSAILTDADGGPRVRAPFLTRLKYALVVRRIEFLPVHFTIGMVPTVMGAHSWKELVALNAILGVLYGITHMELADMMNALADRELDATYKARQPQAIHGLGVRRVVVHIVVTTLFYLAIPVFFAVRTGHWDVLVLGLAAWFMGIQYSFPPLHLKSAGAWQLPSLQIGCVVLPGLVILRGYDRPLEWGAVAVVAGLALIQTAMFVTNHAEDYHEDKQFGIRTYVLAFGLRRAMVVQTTMLTLGGLVTLGGVWLAYGFTWGLIPYAIVWLACVRFMLVVVGEMRAPLDEAITAVRKKALTGPYHGVVLSFMTVLLAFFILAGR